MRDLEMKKVFREGWSHPDRVTGWTTSALQREFDHAPCRSAWRSVLRSAVKGGRVRDVLDVGTGPGTLARLWAELGCNTTGLDFSVPMLDRARAAAVRQGQKIRYVEGDAESPPFPSRSFDVVCSRFVLFTLPHPGLAIRRWIALLRPGGVIVCIGHDHVTTPGLHHKDPKRAWKMPERYRDALGRLPFKDHTSGELLVVLEAAGLRDLRRIPVGRLAAARRALEQADPALPPYEHTPFVLVGRK